MNTAQLDSRVYKDHSRPIRCSPIDCSPKRSECTQCADISLYIDHDGYQSYHYGDSQTQNYTEIHRF